MTAKIELTLTAIQHGTRWVISIPTAKIFLSGVAANPHQSLRAASAAAEELLNAIGFIAAAAIA
ncbi:MAG: hypothetical protein ACRD22_07995 [Terriglobia bacterium]